MRKNEILSQIRISLYRHLKAPFTESYRPPAYRSSSGLTLGTSLETLLDPYKRNRDRQEFQRALRQTDVFFIGHPKSGNTWVAYMLAKILYKDEMNKVTMASVGHYLPVIHGQDSLIARYENLPSPRIFRNEYPVHPQLYPKTIYLVRDPRAALV